VEGGYAELVGQDLPVIFLFAYPEYRAKLRDI